LDHVVWGSAAVGNITPDQSVEIAVVTSSSNLYLLNHDGTIVTGFPAASSGVVRSSPSLADINEDGAPEIMFGSNDGNIYVFDYNGDLLPGYPVSAGGSISAQIVAGDFDGDSSLNIIVVTGGGEIHCLNGTSNIANFPISPEIPAQITATPALGNLDGDLDLEIVVGLKTVGQNLLVIDYKANALVSSLKWPNFGKDIWRSNSLENVVTSVSENDAIPGEFELSQNYPNPFNAVTVISFQLPSVSAVRLEIFDILGRKIETLLDKEMPAGYHKLNWNATGRSSGIYFYRITAGKLTLSRRMLLIK
jgi:hypothetical protein